MFAKVIGLASLITVLCIGWAFAIVVDGVNDFAPADLIDPDGGDTEHAPLDIGDVYAAWDDTAIYLGYGHDQDGWTGVQVGIAIMLPLEAGGTTDPWGHAIGFTGACYPKFIAYMNIDSQWAEWCVWNGSDWDRTPSILNWMVTTTFDEIALPYTLLGIDCSLFSQVFFEIWVTQDGGTKGPFDLSYNDDLQLSTVPGGTIWDITEPVLISCYHCLELHEPSATDASTWGGIKRLYR
ncbi:MAG: hypothetical protein ABIJ00_07535 [Candidatus Eisenbacteria bacterium]